MSLLLNSVTVSDTTSKYFNSKVNILIDSKGIIKKISKNKISDKVKKVVDLEGFYISESWFDFNANFCDPGYEYKENLKSGVHVAINSGFLDVLITPNTNPIIQTKADVSYIQEKSLNNFCKIHPSAAISKNFNGKDLNDIIDLHNSGVKAFTNSYSCKESSEMIMNSLLYLNQIDTLLLTKPKDRSFSDGVVNNGYYSNTVGLKGIPRISESIAVERDLSILEYVGGKIHFSGISTKESVSIIRDAKTKKLNVTCDVPIHNLILDDSNVVSFDPNYKVDPPLRTKDDIDALIEGINDGTIDIIASHHEPQDIDTKKCEFEKANFGVISLQTFFSNIVQLSRKIPLENLIKTFSTNPKKILGVETYSVVEGSKASFTVFDPDGSWDYNENSNLSKSINSPWLNWSLKGKVKAVIKDNRIKEIN
ncbi:MAG: dihydroorotase [Flammeovirgaceae bacterium]|nr:dihydroorotase [Flammeovirgaceae bacterium]